MGLIAADLFLTLDGVYQAPGGRAEDPDGGFPFGGWQAPFTEKAIGASIMESIQRTDALLLGRRTYDIFASFWPFQPADDPVAAKFAAIPKYVVSRTLHDPSWQGRRFWTMSQPSGHFATSSLRFTPGAAASSSAASEPKPRLIA